MPAEPPVWFASAQAVTKIRRMANRDSSLYEQLVAALIAVGGGTVLLFFTNTTRLIPLWSWVLAWIGLFLGLVLFGLLTTARLRSWLKRRSGRASAAVPPEPRPPASTEQILAAVERGYWGTARYKAECEWNTEEGRAYVSLHRRDTDAPHEFRIVVDDPTHLRSEHTFSQSGEWITYLYPDNFESAPMSLLPGEYTVTWVAAVDGPDFVPVASGGFVVPPGSVFPRQEPEQEPGL
jgi:hypothetical protein